MEHLIAKIKSAGSCVCRADLFDNFQEHLDAAAREFNLGPDDMADVKRLDPKIASFGDLITKVRAWKDVLSRNAEAAKKDGTLRSYKNFVLAIHALQRRGVDQMDFTQTLGDVAQKVVSAAQGAAPDDLGEGGRKLWNASFGGSAVRVKTCVLTILMLAAQTPLDPIPESAEAEEGMPSLVEFQPGERAQAAKPEAGVPGSNNEDEEEEVPEVSEEL